MLHVARVIALAFLLLAGITLHPAAATTVWYEDNNLGRADGMPTDFVDKFRNPKSFEQAARLIDVYLLRTNTMWKLPDDFFTSLFFPFLKEHNIKLALNSGGAYRTQQNARRRAVFRRNIDDLKRLKRLGGQVDYISLQSVLSKGWRSGYPMNKRVEDVVIFTKAAREIFPQVEIGIIDALPTHGKDYKEPYRQLVDAMTAAGLKLSYIHLDLPVDVILTKHNGMSWEKLAEIEHYVEDDLKVKLGLITTSRRGGKKASRAFHASVMKALECYRGYYKGTPADLLIMSWFPYPDKTVPETATSDNYPLMRTVLEYGRQLSEIEAKGPEWAAAHVPPSGWDKFCATSR
jgi:hypothetical protein